MAELAVRREGSAKDLNIKFNYEFRASTPHGTGPLEQEHVVESSSDLVRRFRDKLDDIINEAVGPNPAGSDPIGALRTTGAHLHRVLFPPVNGSIPELVTQLRQARGPLLIRTNESDIPWELLYDGGDFLGLRHELGRRTFVNRQVNPGRDVDTIGHALIVGDPLNDLSSARLEAEQVSSWLTGRGVNCVSLLGAAANLGDVFEELSTGHYDLLHYSGHVAQVADKYVGLRLHGDELLYGKALEPLAQFGAPPIVFINGCASADRLASLCESFMIMGAKIVVGTRHPVGDEPARKFAECFYTDLVDGATAGSAVLAARRLLHSEGLIEWASFVLYGDPEMRIAVGGSLPTAQYETKAGPNRYRMDSEAQDVIDRMVRSAGFSGFATSLDLLLELLPTEAMRGKITNAFGAERLAFVTELLHVFRGTLPASDADIGPVDFSDTVNTVLVRAERAAAEVGRDTITVADLVDEFVAVGGGSSGQILSLMGISLPDLGQAPAHVFASPTAHPDTRTNIPTGAAAIPVSGSATDRGNDLFDESGELRLERLNPDLTRAVRTAALVASMNGSTISGGMMLYGMLLAGSGVLWDALEREGAPGAAAVEMLSPKRRIRQHRFSARTRDLLVRALAGREQLDETAVLRSLLAEPNSSARALLRKVSVDPDRLVRHLPGGTATNGALPAEE